MVEQFKLNYDGEEVQRVRLQEIFLLFEAAKTDAERDEIINKLDSEFIYGYYQHVKPADVKQSTGKEEEMKAESRFDYDKHYKENQFEKSPYSRDHSDVNYVHRYCLTFYDFTGISDGALWSFIQCQTSFAGFINDSFFKQLYINMQQNYRINKNYSPSAIIYDKFTLEQLEMFGKEVPEIKSDSHYIGKIFEKRFHFELDHENKDTFTLEERREQLIQMYKASEDRPQSLKSALLLEILENGVKLDIYDKNYFIEYLEHPLKSWLMNKSIQKKAEIYDGVWSGYIANMHNRSGGVMDKKLDKKLYKKYLEQFYDDKGNIDEFKQYFDDDFIRSLCEEFDFFAGKDIKKSKVSTKAIESMTNLVLIELLE